MFEPGLTAEERASAQAWGLTDDEIDGAPVQVWPSNVESVLVLLAMRTQWRTGMGGATGLDYTVLPLIFQRTGVPPERQDLAFADLQVMEIAALAAMHSNRQKASDV